MLRSSVPERKAGVLQEAEVRQEAGEAVRRLLRAVKRGELGTDTPEDVVAVYGLVGVLAALES